MPPLHDGNWNLTPITLAILPEQNHQQHSLFPASACDFCESIVGNGRPDPVLSDPVLSVLYLLPEAATAAKI